MTSQFKVNNLADSDIHDTKESLVPAFELALIKHLDGHNRRVLDGTVVTYREPKFGKKSRRTYTSKFSFQYGLRVFLITLVVCVCSVSTVITAKGSGSLKTSRLARPSAATTSTEGERHGEIRDDDPYL
jgi:hypothetical protein